MSAKHEFRNPTLSSRAGACPEDIKIIDILRIPSYTDRHKEQTDEQEE